MTDLEKVECLRKAMTKIYNETSDGDWNVDFVNKANEQAAMVGRILGIASTALHRTL